MHEAYYNNAEIQNAWKRAAIDNLKPMNIREALIKAGRLIPPKPLKGVL